MLSQSKSILTLDDNPNVGSFHLRINAQSVLYSNEAKNIGVNTITPTNKLTLSCATNDGICMINSASLGTSSIYLGPIGEMKLSSTSNLIQILSNMDVPNHNGSTSGLFLNGILITATATKINYIDTTPGVAASNKALVTNSQLNISNINSLSTNTIVLGDASISSDLNPITGGSIIFNSDPASIGFLFNGQISSSVPILPTSGGTGFASYSKGDILVATTSSTLTKVSLPISNNYMLQADNSAASGVSWGMSNLQYYQLFVAPIYQSANNYLFNQCITMDSTYLYNIKVLTPANINLLSNGVNGLDISLQKTGTIFPANAATTIAGTGTTFLNEDRKSVV